VKVPAHFRRRRGGGDAEGLDRGYLLKATYPVKRGQTIPFSPPPACRPIAAMG
jgi:hypothetical protein